MQNSDNLNSWMAKQVQCAHEQQAASTLLDKLNDIIAQSTAHAASYHMTQASQQQDITLISTKPRLANMEELHQSVQQTTHTHKPCLLSSKCMVIQFTVGSISSPQQNGKKDSTLLTPECCQCQQGLRSTGAQMYFGPCRSFHNVHKALCLLLEKHNAVQQMHHFH